MQQYVFRKQFLLLVVHFNLIYAESHLLFNDQEREISSVNKEIDKRLVKLDIAKKMLYAAPFTQDYEYLITSYEWQELNISEYLRMFDHTQTACGPWGLYQLIKPVTDYHVIKERQQSIVQLDHDQKQFYHFCRLLDQISKHEEHLLAYYKERDDLNEKAEQLYYSCFQSVLNESKVALDYSYLTDMIHSAGNLATLLCLNGLFLELLLAQVEGRSISISKGLRGGLTHVFNSHNPDDQMYQTYKKNDKFAVSVAQSEDQLSSDDTLLSRVGVIPDYVKQSFRYLVSKFSTPASVYVFTQGSFGDKWSYYNEQLHLPSALSLLCVIGQVAYQDQSLYMRVRQNYRRLVSLFNTHTALQHRSVLITQLINFILEIIDLAQAVPALQNHSAIKRAYALLHDGASLSIRSLLEQLQSSTYAEKKQFIYSRGQVLITHKLLKEIKMELVPILQAVGIIDGFISVCSTYQEHKLHETRRFCFADIIQTQEPICCLKDAWLPLISGKHVYNSCTLGDEGQLRNMLLTGPNGGGKSSLLKLIGGSVVLAHSWGIVPASEAKISLFKGLRTSFNPPDDITRGISTFMAQQKRLSKLENYIAKADQTGCYMLLIDEPYRGTIEVEAERRAYNFATHIGQYPSTMLIMASHFKKPLSLEDDTGVFRNMHLQIDAHDDGSFTRLFKLSDGASWWWFHDIDKRMRFVDWLHTFHPQEAI